MQNQHVSSLLILLQTLWIPDVSSNFRQLESVRYCFIEPHDLHCIVRDQFLYVFSRLSSLVLRMADIFGTMHPLSTSRECCAFIFYRAGSIDGVEVHVMERGGNLASSMEMRGLSAMQ
ncbi:hypothetical protein GOODEAATRI_018173 [Goodea atripinnis]|uniref:Uncharacterized protein n=1 Tax=Goodea atripinnis TaxID=208336 RepID=A0ABV0NBM7_9TELE